MKAQLISAVTAIAMLCALTAQIEADEPVVVKKEKVKVIVAGDDSEPQVVQLNGDDLEIGESRQIFTDDGKEIVVSRSEEGLEVSVDGETIDIGALHGAHGHDGNIQVHHKVIEHLADGDAKAMVFVGKGGHEVDIEQIVADHGGKAHRVFISKDGETVDLEGIDSLKWTGHPRVQILGAGLGEHLEESGAFDNLSDEQRQKILDAIDSYHESVHVDTRVMVLDTDDSDVH